MANLATRPLITRLADFADLTKLMGFESVWDFDRRHQD